MKKINKIQEAIDLVDVILSGGYSDYKKLQEASDITNFVLDELENKIDTVPDQNIDQLKKSVRSELSKDDKQDKKENEYSAENIITTSIKKLIHEEDYREFFKSMMQKHNISSPSELSGDEKKKFFDAVSKEWKKKKGSD